MAYKWLLTETVSFLFAYDRIQCMQHMNDSSMKEKKHEYLL